jgi:hypothetical protein
VTYRADKLDPPRMNESPMQLFRWRQRVFELLNGIQTILAGSIEMSSITIGSSTYTDIQESIEQVVSIIETQISPLLEAHKSRHETGGADEINVDGLVGELGDDQPPKAHANEKHSVTFEDTANKDIASGYAGLNSVSRINKGVDTEDDIIVDSDTKGLVLKDSQATPHYWRLTVSSIGGLVITDAGVDKP